jgi:hypothetical protein
MFLVRKSQRCPKPLLALGLLAMFVAPWVVSAQDANTIRSVRAVQSGVEIEVHSATEFPVRANIVVLRIGDKEFTQSRNPADGSLNTLIFTLTPGEFAQVNHGDPVSVYYGRGETGGRWNFGALNKPR